MFEEIKEQHSGKVVDILVSNAGYGKRIVDIWYFTLPFSPPSLLPPFSTSPSSPAPSPQTNAPHPARDIPLSEFEHTLNINLRASFILVKGVVEGMKAQRWGRIIFMSSIAAMGGGINGCRMSLLSLFPSPSAPSPSQISLLPITPTSSHHSGPQLTYLPNRLRLI